MHELSGWANTTVAVAATGPDAAAAVRREDRQRGRPRRHRPKQPTRPDRPKLGAWQRRLPWRWMNPSVSVSCVSMRISCPRTYQPGCAQRASSARKFSRKMMSLAPPRTTLHAARKRSCSLACCKRATSRAALSVCLAASDPVTATPRVGGFPEPTARRVCARVEPRSCCDKRVRRTVSDRQASTD